MRLRWLLLAAAIFVPEALAQDPAAEGEAGGQETKFIDLIIAGGWAMYPLGLLSLMWVALVVYNMPALTNIAFEPDTVRRLMDEPVMVA